MRLLLVACAVATVGSVAHAADTTTTPFPGIKHVHRKTATQDIHVLLVDLCAPGVRIRATKHAERGRTVSSFGTLVGAKAAINANFFNLTTYETSGPAMGEGEEWGGEDSNVIAPAQFGPYRVALPAGGSTVGLQTWAKNAVSGRPSLIVNGVAKDASAASTCDARNPRTGLGFTANRETLILATVDGRRTDAVGMTCNELGTLLKGFGAADAINLDGGGSSTMWLSGAGVVNQPSDGAQRTVGNHLAVLATGTGDAPNCPRARYEASAAMGDTMLELVSGASGQVALDVKNDSNVAWDQTVQLATEPVARESAFADASWLSPSSPVAAMKTESGASAHFAWTMTAPVVTETTTFSETFQLVHDEMPFGPTQTIDIVVTPPSGDGDDDGSPSAGGCSTGGGTGGGMILALYLVIRSRRCGSRSRASY
ncbi:MAG TPA: phosphodiester glycosidase family protein [Kofleriaceae bacterium]|nr:phosphodiester glycosidase family protein [Kofleriaceae bacterium]